MMLKPYNLQLNFSVLRPCLAAFVTASLACIQVSAQELHKQGLQSLGTAFTSLQPIAGQQARVVLYRMRPGKVTGAASVFVAGNYHTSLIPGGYSEVCVTPGEVELAVRSVRADRNVRDAYDSITVIQLHPGKNHFVRVNDNQQSQVILQPISEKEALSELRDSKEQVHTISRVPSGQCSVSAHAGAAQSTETQKFNLSADALFEFARGDLDALSIRGRIELDKLIESTARGYLALQEIRITGHADPLGNEQINQKLAYQRARTIRQYLIDHGLSNVRMDIDSRGSSEPVRKDCGLVSKPLTIACHSPNRRVEIAITGMRR